MKIKVFCLAAALFLAPTTFHAVAAPLVYTPVNPSFGGNPLNSSHLMGLASAQRSATAIDAKSGTDGGGVDPTPTPGSTDADLFIRQLQGRLLSALASQVTDAIFGPDPAEAGTVVFGSTTVRFEHTLTAINLTITDPTGTTVISVPKLLVK